jgi:putative glutamine amidotransferase
MKPLIGITPEAIASGRTDGRGVFCGLSYARAIEQAGGAPVILPLTDKPALLDVFVERCAGFVLSGGGDASEASGAYGRKLTVSERRSLGSVEPMRDAMEIALARQLVQRDVPVLGICRGIQLLNVALGGTLLPDIPNHRDRRHPVEWAPSGRLPGLLRGCRQVNSTHHQAVGRLAPGLVVVARAADGIVEAVEFPGQRFCAAVQFHPERLVADVPSLRRLFRAFVAAC